MTTRAGIDEPLTIVRDGSTMRADNAATGRSAGDVVDVAAVVGASREAGRPPLEQGSEQHHRENHESPHAAMTPSSGLAVRPAGTSAARHPHRLPDLAPARRVPIGSGSLRQEGFNRAEQAFGPAA